MWRRGDLTRLRRLTVGDRLLLIEAVLWLGVARIAILTIPFRWTARFFALHPGGTTTEIPAGSAVPRRVRRALGAASGRTPWKSTCLVQALAGSGMLRLRGIPATVALGVAKSQGEAGSLEAHAWLSCGGRILTGEAGHDRFQVVGKFSLGKSRS